MLWTLKGLPQPKTSTEGQEERVPSTVSKGERKNKALLRKERKEKEAVFSEECCGCLVNTIRSSNSWGRW